MKHEQTQESLEAAFADWSATLGEGRLDDHYAYFHEDANILDEDTPWSKDKKDFITHIDFHLASNDGKGLWEFAEWVPRETKFKVIGSTGHTVGFATWRGKPRDTGFRQRFMAFTLTWVFVEDQWKILCWHQSVLAGRIMNASPT